MTAIDVAIANLESVEQSLAAAECEVTRAEATLAASHDIRDFIRVVHSQNDLAFWSRAVSLSERKLAEVQADSATQ